ncbi:hypothetical protein QYM36_019159, partial [Artemia franciscana]
GDIIFGMNNQKHLVRRCRAATTKKSNYPKSCQNARNIDIKKSRLPFTLLLLGDIVFGMDNQKQL